MGWEFLWIFLVASLVLSAVGFYKFVYFLSIGYGLSVAGIGVALAIMSACGVFENVGVQAYILFALLFIYGMRLSGFLLVRELKNAMYRKTLQEATGDEKKIPIFVKATIWLCVAVLYTAQTCTAFYRVYNMGGNSIAGWIGIAICVIAIIIESLADKQKSDQKKIRPDMVATKGLYKIVRCPNYFGEILFWTGIFVSGVDVLNHWGQWVMAILAYICIVYIMFNGAQRLERRQMKRYGDNEEYNTYVNKTPIIIPLLPIYHLVKKEDEKVSK